MQQISKDKRKFILFILAVGFLGASIGVTVQMPVGANTVLIIITLVLLGYLIFQIIADKDNSEADE